MQALSLRVITIIALCCFFVACSPTQQNTTTPMSEFALLTPQQKVLWLANVCRIFDESKDFFNAADTADTAKVEKEVSQLFDFTLPESTAAQAINKQSSNNTCLNTDSASFTTPTNNTAQAERARIRQVLALTFLASFLGELESEFTLTKQNETLQSLNNMLKLYPVFTGGTAELYAFNRQHQVFAFKRTGADNVRAYVAFNLSFDVQEMPLPLGFMASTKVTVWRSDSPSVDTFVTNQAFTMPALSAIIVIVGANSSR